ncbi:MAG: HAMP domain-containing histidine kinase [Saprospiraceae bacterium]|nr:HAMP domain-containing histidine kinase [Saprospiraceae bacterium]
MDRLNLVADRFSKIGSSSELKSVDLNMQLEDVLKYMERRASRKVTFDPLQTTEKTHFAMINEHLFRWVVENLIGMLWMRWMASISKSPFTMPKVRKVLTFQDSGKGIPPENFKTVFQPLRLKHQTTWWGLGSSRPKRIVENYHNGKIFCEGFKPREEGTTFTIKL